MTERKALTGRDYIETHDWSVEEIDEALAVAAELKAKFKRDEPTRLLPDRTLFMLFLDKSTRTRNAFEAGMTQLGGHAHFLDADKTQIATARARRTRGYPVAGTATASPSATTSSPTRATPTCARWPGGRSARSSTCSATSTTPRRRSPTS